MAFNIAKRILVAKREAVAGTKETLADADFDVRMRGSEFTPDIQNNDEDSKFTTGDYGEDVSISGMQGATATSMTKLSSGASIGVAPKYNKLFEGCGLVEEVFAGVGVGYQPLSSGDKQTITLGKCDISDGGTPVGIQADMCGVMGNMTLSAEGVGSPLSVAYEWKGKFVSLTDLANASILSLTSPDTTIGSKMLNGTATIFGQSLCLQSFSMNLGNTIEYLPCPSESTGIKYSTIVNRQPRATLTFIAPVASVLDPLSDTILQTENSILLTFGDWSLIIPRAQILSYSESDYNGRLGYELNLKLNRNSGADANLADESTFQLLQGAIA